MEISQEQIRRFLANKCRDEEEGEAVAAYLTAHPNVLEVWMSESALLKDRNQPTGQAIVPSAEMLISIRRQAYGKVRRLWTRAAVAALFAGLAMGGTMLWQRGNSRVLAATQFAAADTSNVSEDHIWEIARDNSAHSRRLVMADGSDVVLEPGAVLEYRTDFASNRTVRLKGGAYFKVAKDTRHPFSVVAEGYVTKVLGTSFRILATSGRKDVHIILYSGKVSVEQEHNDQTFTPVVLLPGQQLVIDKTTAIARVTTGPGDLSQKGSDVRRVTLTAEGDMAFHQASLSVLFRELGERYSVTITFPAKQMDHLDFTGIIYKEDDIDTILKNLSGLYNLILVKSETGFTISK